MSGWPGVVVGLNTPERLASGTQIVRQNGVCIRRAGGSCILRRTSKIDRTDTRSSLQQSRPQLAQFNECPTGVYYGAPNRLHI